VYNSRLTLFPFPVFFLPAAEAICAGRDPNTNVVVLVHGQIISGGNVAIKVRSQDASLSQRCLQIAINALN
jgi:hypothetical protein